MKKIILSLLLTVGVSLASQAQTFTYTANILAGTQTNILTGPFKITSITASSTNAASGLLVDDATGTNVNYVVGAYSNVVSYLTNSYNLATNGGYNQFTYTNYFGVVTMLTNSTPLTQPLNLVQVDVTNSVAASTNALPSAAISMSANVPTIINPANITFYRGVSFTNSSPTLTPKITITITGVRL